MLMQDSLYSADFDYEYDDENRSSEVRESSTSSRASSLVVIVIEVALPLITVCPACAGTEMIYENYMKLPRSAWLFNMSNI